MNTQGCRNSSLPNTLDELLEVDPQKMSDEELQEYVIRMKTLRSKDLRQVIEDESKGKTEHHGFIYVLSNPAMPGLLKIGFTSGRIGKRTATLTRNTGVPEPFHMEGKFPVYIPPQEAEREIHRALDIFRLRRNREFFRLSPENAMNIIRNVLESSDK